MSFVLNKSVTTIHPICYPFKKVICDLHIVHLHCSVNRIIADPL